MADWGTRGRCSRRLIKQAPTRILPLTFQKKWRKTDPLGIAKRDSILNQRNWFFNNHALYLQPWTPNCNPIPLVYYSDPVWIRLYNLPIEYCGDGFLEKVGRLLGTVMEVDVDDEVDLCKYAKLRIAVVRHILDSIYLLMANGEWHQQLEIEKEIRQCQRCESRMHREEG
ncbi:hypothetical protein SUGI_0531350 [Cryptomeria japonica]|nr:hypothetical protein SUGI_0531350 [Cryptomeria japonica]